MELLKKTDLVVYFYTMLQLSSFSANCIRYRGLDKHRNSTTTDTTRLHEKEPASLSLYTYIHGRSKTPDVVKTTKTRLFSKTGYYLVVHDNGVLAASLDSLVAEERGNFGMQQVNKSVVRMKNVKTQRFVAIDNTGQVYTSSNVTGEALLDEHRTNGYFHSYSSHKYGGWYITVNQRGRVKTRKYSFISKKRKKKSHLFFALEIV